MTIDLESMIALREDADRMDDEVRGEPTLDEGLTGNTRGYCSGGEEQCGETAFTVDDFPDEACIRVITLQSYLPSGELGNFSTELEPHIIAFPGCFNECDMSNEFSSAKLQQIDCSGNLALTLEICTDATTCASAFSIWIESGDLEYIEDQDLKIEFKPLPELSE
jgi:hypothetical protein